jgi:hypothetical protein
MRPSNNVSMLIEMVGLDISQTDDRPSHLFHFATSHPVLGRRLMGYAKRCVSFGEKCVIEVDGGHTLNGVVITKGTRLFKGYKHDHSLVSNTAKWLSARSVARSYGSIGVVYEYEVTRDLVMLELVNRSNVETLDAMLSQEDRATLRQAVHIDESDPIETSRSFKFRSGEEQNSWTRRAINGRKDWGEAKMVVAKDGTPLRPFTSQRAHQKFSQRQERAKRDDYVYDDPDERAFEPQQLVMADDILAMHEDPDATVCGTRLNAPTVVRTSGMDGDVSAVRMLNRVFGDRIDGWCHDTTATQEAEVVVFDRRFVRCLGPDAETPAFVKPDAANKNRDGGGIGGGKWVFNASSVTVAALGVVACIATCVW